MGRWVFFVLCLAVVGGVSYWLGRGDQAKEELLDDPIEIESADDPLRRELSGEVAIAGDEDLSRLVARLHEASNEARAAAAASLRRALAANPSARTNDHGRVYWEQRIAQVNPGMKHAEVVTLLRPHDQGERGSSGSGVTHVATWRLDHYWIVVVQYRNPDSVIKRPTLHRRAMSIWVKPPKEHTGTWVTWHVNGQKSHEIEYENGKYDGRFTSYHDNGREAVEQHYRSGICSGVATGWSRNGRKCYEGQYASGKRQGTWTHWYEDGQLRSREQLKNGETDGIRTTWHPSGQKQYEVHYRSGKKHGPDRAWDEAGRLLWSREYRNGVLVRG